MLRPPVDLERSDARARRCAWAERRRAAGASWFLVGSW